MQNFLLLLSLFLPAFAFGQAESDHSHPDGPYLMYNSDGELMAKWAWPEKREAGELVWSKENLPKLPEFTSFRPETIVPDTAFRLASQVEFEGVKKLAVVSDIHGQYDVIVKLLQSHGIMDDAFHWSYGDGHFIVVGDIFDRGDQVTETLWLIYNLQLEAAAAGGRVHFLLGNHETMIMEGDIRYIHKRYLTTGALFTQPYQQLYGPDSYLGRWLRSLPLIVRINDMVFVHGGLSKEMVQTENNISQINKLYHKSLMDTNQTVAINESPKLDLLHGESGPLWYRGYFLDREFAECDIDKILKKVKAERMIVGHTSFDAVKSFFNGKVLAVDSSIKFGSMGEVLLVEDGQLLRGGLLGERLPLEHSEKK